MSAAGWNECFCLYRRSAGDGCSPSTSAATSQDLQRACKDPSPVRMLSVQVQSDPQYDDHMMEYGLCNDPDHAEAHTIILEMHQILADRDAELQRLTEEKRFYQLELIHWERNLAHQRGGVPLALMPDGLTSPAARSNRMWKGYSAPPVTKPRLPDMALCQSPVLSGAASYDIFSDSNVSQAEGYMVHSIGAHDTDDEESRDDGFITPL